jgi:hypothetical protein
VTTTSATMSVRRHPISTADLGTDQGSRVVAPPEKRTVMLGRSRLRELRSIPASHLPRLSGTVTNRAMTSCPYRSRATSSRGSTEP